VTSVERREQVAQASAARVHRDPGTGLRLISLGVALWLVTLLVLIVLWLSGANVNDWSGSLGLVVFTASLALVTRGRRMRVAGAERLLAEDTRAPIGFLRSFALDSAEIATRWSSRTRIYPAPGSRRRTRSGSRTRCATSDLSSR
jgi:hypothetical protein